MRPIAKTTTIHSLVESATQTPTPRATTVQTIATIHTQRGGTTDKLFALITGQHRRAPHG